MLDTTRQWNYDEDVASVMNDYEEGDEYGQRRGYNAGRGTDSGYDDYDDYGDDGEDYGDDLGNYGSDLSGFTDNDADIRTKERVERVMDSAFLLNETDGFAGRPDAEKIRNNFRQYVKDAVSDDPAVKEAAQEGACRDLEFFIISLINRSFRTYVEKDREFFEDLMQAGRLGVMMSLARYDPDKSMPTTYFFNPIKHELVAQVNVMKHDTKSHMATAKRKIQEIDRQFAKYGRTPMLHDYVHGTKCPYHRIVNALAEIRAGNVKSSLDDPDMGPLPDNSSTIPDPEEKAISTVNATRIIRILYQIEPRREIVDCFIEMFMDGSTKASKLAQKYGLTQSEMTEGIRTLGNLARYHPEIRKMYPERFRVKENELSEEIAYLPVEEGKRALASVLDSLKTVPMNSGDIDITFLG